MSDTESDLRRALNACDEALRTAVALKNEIQAERDRYRDALEAARDALADPNAMAEDTDSPANMAFAIVNHALAAFDEPESASPSPSGEEQPRPARGSDDNAPHA